MMRNRAKNRRKAPSARAPRLPALNWRPLARWCASVGGVLAVAAALTWALNRPIRTLTLTGSFRRVTPVQVAQAVRRQVGTAGLMSVDLTAVRRAVEALPWVDSASVQRDWPRGLAVRITEEVAAARWNEGGLINRRGQLFATAVQHVPQGLPRLSGPAGSEALVARRFLSARSRLLDDGLRITALRLDRRGAWQIDLDDGVTVRLGRERFEERFDTFLSTAVRIVARRAADIAYVDMRYSNGFAIGWRHATAHRGGGGGGHHA